MVLRKYRPGDLETLIDLFRDTVNRINIKDYTSEQVRVWTAGAADKDRWQKSLLSHYTVIAEIDGTVAGFGDIDETGYLDRLYVHYAFQSRGVASAICDRLESAVTAPMITTHASITARGFFEKRGYTVIKEQQVERGGIYLTNFVMEYRPCKSCK